MSREDAERAAVRLAYSLGAGQHHTKGFYEPLTNALVFLRNAADTTDNDEQRQWFVSQAIASLQNRNSLDEPSPAQMEALRAYAKAWGTRTWKSALLDDWSTASARVNGEISAELQQVRNSFGPTWLAKQNAKSFLK